MKQYLFVVLLNGALCLAQGELIPLALSPPGTDAATGLSPLNEVIPFLSTGSGNAFGAGITFDTTSLTLSLSVGYGSAAGFTDLTGPASSCFLHGPATTSETAPVLFDLAPILYVAANPSHGGIIFGSLHHTPSQASDLLAGLDYINIYTASYPGGEIRGQLTVIPEPLTSRFLLLAALAFSGSLWVRRANRGS